LKKDPLTFIYHITSKEAWQNAQAAGYYSHPSLETEGFIHCSEAHQGWNDITREVKTW
jgi:uncharacterized protein (DUF952 family)